MALQLLDGTSAVTDLLIGPGTAGAGTGASSATQSYKCVANYVSVDIGRDMFEATTFCSGGWRARTPGLKQVTGRMEGFASKGWAGADPLALFQGQLPYDWTAQMDTSCNFTGSIHITTDHSGERAAAQSERGINFESWGVVMTHWIVS